MRLASAPVLARRSSFALVALAGAWAASGCARDARPATGAELAHIHAACPPGSFVAAMASDCPQVVR